MKIQKLVTFKHNLAIIEGQSLCGKSLGPIGFINELNHESYCTCMIFGNLVKHDHWKLNN